MVARFPTHEQERQSPSPVANTPFPTSTPPPSSLWGVRHVAADQLSPAGQRIRDAIDESQRRSRCAQSRAEKSWQERGWNFMAEVR